jgi:hypothetical protein
MSDIEQMSNNYLKQINEEIYECIQEGPAQIFFFPETSVKLF